MKKIIIKFITISLILFSVVQVVLNNKFTKEQSEFKREITHTDNKSIKYKDLSTLSKELNCLKNVKIISASNDRENWKVKVRVTGSKEDIINEIINFQKYEITSYTIIKNYEGSFVILEVCES